jgi:hypothetical protein
MSGLTDPPARRNLSTRRPRRTRRQRRYELRRIGSDASTCGRRRRGPYYAIAALYADGGECCKHNNDKPLSCLEFVLSFPADTRLSAFHFSYDVSAMLRGITRRDERSGDPTETRVSVGTRPDQKSPTDQAE